MNWERIGWRVRVGFKRLSNLLRPKDHIGLLGPLLPGRYSSLQRNGNGIQSVYLTELSAALAQALIALIGPEAVAIAEDAQPDVELVGVQPATADLELREEHLTAEVVGNSNLGPTERDALIVARRGQGLFKQRVMQIEHRCRITHVENPVHLRASHCKPWRDSNNQERLNGENGLLLTPTIDHLFDRGFISFEDNGTLIISPVAHRPSLRRMGLETDAIVYVGPFSQGQRGFLDYHRNAVLLRASR